MLRPAASKSPGGMSSNSPPTAGEGKGRGQPTAGGAEPPGTFERHVRSRGPNSTATIAKAMVAATSAIARGTARGRSPVSRGRTSLVRRNHRFRYGCRLESPPLAASAAPSQVRLLPGTNALGGLRKSGHRPGRPDPGSRCGQPDGRVGDRRGSAPRRKRPAPAPVSPVPSYALTYGTRCRYFRRCPRPTSGSPRAGD